MEFIFIIAAIVILFLVAYFIKKRLSPKTNWFISVIGFAALIAVFFIMGIIDRITTTESIILSICVVVYCFYLYHRYKNLQNG